VIACSSVRRLLICAVFLSLAACGNGNSIGSLFMKKVVLNVVVYNYTDRPIFEVLLNGRIGHGAPPYFGGNAVYAGATISLGPQTLIWRLGGPKGTPRNGDVVATKNALMLTADQIPGDARYLAIHIYPDDTTELTFTHDLPEATLHGQKILEEVERSGR
jgi:hypothetical protein